jgi:hypothetical protein
MSVINDMVAGWHSGRECKGCISIIISPGKSWDEMAAVRLGEIE